MGSEIWDPDQTYCKISENNSSDSDTNFGAKVAKNKSIFSKSKRKKYKLTQNSEKKYSSKIWESNWGDLKLSKKGG